MSGSTAEAPTCPGGGAAPWRPQWPTGPVCRTWPAERPPPHRPASSAYSGRTLQTQPDRCHVGLRQDAGPCHRVRDGTTRQAERRRHTNSGTGARRDGVCRNQGQSPPCVIVGVGEQRISVLRSLITSLTNDPRVSTRNDHFETKSPLQDT